MPRYTINDSNSYFNTTNPFDSVRSKHTVVDAWSKLLTWLSPLDPGLRHRGIQERRVNNVGEWLMESEEFRRWCRLGEEGGGDTAVLFCYGDPGAGKTFVSSLVVDWLRNQTRGQNTAVTCFYFDFAAGKEQTPTGVLGSLLKQIVSGMERIPEAISRALQEQKAVNGRKPQLVDIAKMLQLTTSSLPTFMVIDALDECTAAQRFPLFDSLKEILKKSPGTRIFVTGRPHIRWDIERCLAGRVTSLSIGPTRDDIVRFLRARLSEDETPDAMDTSLEADILEKIPESISEMFLLASLNIEAILQESTVYRRRERLSKITNGLLLGDAYDATIERIKVQGGNKSRLGMGALMWISYAERPLRVDELCHALAVELGSTDFNPGEVPSMSELVGYCQGLIIVDKEESTVRPIHFTLVEYLSSHPHIFDRPHSSMAEVCLTYLNSDRIKAIQADRCPDPLGNPFLEYCSLHWGAHARKELSHNARSLALVLFQEYDSHISAQLLLKEVNQLDLRSLDRNSRFSGLHCASFFGIVEVVATLIGTESRDINEGDSKGCTPLSWAACNGHEEVVKILLGQEGVNSDKFDNYGQTPLSLAARNGHKGVVKILLGQEEVDPDRPDNRGQTPISYAAQYGHEGVAEILLGREEVNPNGPDNGGRTPLSYAAQYRGEGVVKILLEREEVYPNKPDNSGRTPLSYAVHYGGEGVAKILLEREGVCPDEPDNSGRTPLSYAVQFGGEEVVEILLGLGQVDPNRPDNRGQTPLSHAAQYGCGGAVRILLGREGVAPDRPDHYSKTPLSYAAWGGHEVVVETLLRRQEVNPDKPDSYGGTPLSYAAWRGHAGVVKILLEREEVNPDGTDNRGQTPLSYAAQYGHEGVVEILLGREEVNPNKPDNGSRTPLSYAAQYGREGVVKILLKREEVAPDKPDNDGQTPLMFACKHGHDGVVALLPPY